MHFLHTTYVILRNLLVIVEPDETSFPVLISFNLPASSFFPLPGFAGKSREQMVHQPVKRLIETPHFTGRQ